MDQMWSDDILVPFDYNYLTKIPSYRVFVMAIGRQLLYLINVGKLPKFITFDTRKLL